METFHKYETKLFKIKKVNRSRETSEHGPKKRNRAIANIVAGTIVSLFSLLISIFSTIFRALASLA